ncbi:5-oxoprolinase subunit B family protein [Spirochaeta isovalerica]|uniref:KipI family sensor histidine kinase inhibitor n=1 Tax=Spirochaeta isovalerica TaxID=150 RepID=A0A841RCB5_9SPIO|nr:allophanate hydrolase subunit 1 [Spirochaeta isovalerica]MBB6480867.1 KipI family sensor histidine kinase inhibitor [Spirochaeta isovalerica]
MYVQNLGDGSLSFVIGDRIDRETSRRILKLYKTMKNSSLPGELSIYDIVPSYCSLTFHFDPLKTDCVVMEEELWPVIASQLRKAKSSSGKGKSFHIPVIYRGEDLNRVSRLTGLTVKQIIRRHTYPSYQVAMIGFRPHFPYLIGLDRKLATRRLDTPRLKICAGSVGIGGSQTGVYPEDSPGGWNIIGYTDPQLLKELSPGDTLKFCEVSRL